MDSFNGFDGFSDSPVDGFSSTFMFVFFLIVAIIVGVFVYQATKGLTIWNKNNNSPIEQKRCKIVSKRSDVSYYHHQNTSSTSTTTYYCTFEFEDGRRLELKMKRSEFGLLAEHDEGMLEYQGTRFLKFERYM